MRGLFVCIGLIILLGACSQPGSGIVYDMQVDYLTNPLGLENESPRFIWKISDKSRGALQTGYQLVVSTEEDDKGIIWDTKKLESDKTLNIKYRGPRLESGKKYYWKVKIWDKDGESSKWSNWSYFQMGLLTSDDKKAKWITIPDTSVSSPLLRSEFEISKNIQSAYAYTSAIGYYELYLNGEKVGGHLIDPAMTDFRKRVLYETYDITKQIKEGRNAFGLWLGNGGFRVGRTEGRWSWYGSNYSYGTPRGWLQVEIIYTDGSKETIITDETWKADGSPIVYNDVYGGEDYDARLEQDGWNTIDFNDLDWVDAEVIDHSEVNMESQLMPAIKVIEKLRPVASNRSGSHTYLFDFGQNFAGIWSIEVEGEEGAQIKIRGAETLNDSLFPEPLKNGARLSMDKVYHREVWSTYTLNGNGTESFHPRFFYSGFRYMEVVVEKGSVESVNAEGLVIHNDLERNGQFKSSDSLLNQIYRAAIWSQKGNLHGYPTDCPHREKGGYNGDGQVIAETSIHDFQMHSFYAKWLKDMRDSQYENGRIPNTSPAVIGGVGGGIAWGSAYILLPVWMYDYYSDKELLEEHYPSMKRYMSYLKNLASNDENPHEKFIINEFGGHWDSLGEWEAPVRDRNGPINPLTNTYYWYLNTLAMARIAEALEQEDDQDQFKSLAESIKKAFNEKFYLSDLHLYGTEEPYQGYLLFALNGNLVPEGDREEVLQNLIDDILIKSDGHLGTGMLGTKHLFPVLSKAGREDVSHTIVTKKTFPSWGYWIENGATTLWENWKGGNSHNHQMFGTVNEYFYKYLAGIRPPGEGLTTNSYKKIHIEPFLPDDLENVKASIESVRGEIISEWERKDGVYEFNISIPANTRGIFTIPFDSNQLQRVTENGKALWERETGIIHDIPGIKNVESSNGKLSVTIDPGSYNFTVQ